MSKKTPAVDLLVAQRVAAIRLSAELSQAELAARANLEVSQVVALEQGKRQSMKTLSAISVALNVAMTAFFEGEATSDVGLLKATRH